MPVIEMRINIILFGPLLANYCLKYLNVIKLFLRFFIIIFFSILFTYFLLLILFYVIAYLCLLLFCFILFCFVLLVFDIAKLMFCGIAKRTNIGAGFTSLLQSFYHFLRDLNRLCLKYYVRNNLYKSHFISA